MGIENIIFQSDQLAEQHVRYAHHIASDPGITWGVPCIDKKMLPMRGKSGDVAVIVGRPGDGKCLRAGTKVLMFDGTIKAVEDICVGDLLMGPDSMPRTVVSLARGIDEMYKVVPVKGDPYVVNSDHILSLQMSRMTKDDPEDLVVNISVKDYLKQSEKWKHHAKGYRVGVDWPEREVPIDPYFLGIWLGDGNSNDHAITNPDPEVAEWLRQFAADHGYELHDNSSANRCPTWRITNGKKGMGTSNTILDTLRNMGVIGNKHIPHVYLANGREVRLQLLAGLLDSDGHLQHGCFYIAQKREIVVQGIEFLARSLGLAANRMKNKVVNGETYYRVSICGDIDMIPTKIARKQARPRRQVKNVLRTGITVRPVGKGRYYGFELDGPDGLFLLGDFTVTHNTSMLLSHALNQVRQITAAGLQHEETVLVCTWEGTVDKLYAACVAGIGGEYSKTDFLWGRVPVTQVESVSARHGVMPITFIGFSSFREPAYRSINLEMVLEAAEAIQHGYKVAKRKVRVLYGDYLQIIDTQGRDRTEQTSEATIQGKRLCVRLGIPGMFGAQAGRQVDGRDVKLALPSDVQHSSQVEQHVEFGYSIWRPWRTENPGPTQAHVDVYGQKLPLTPRLAVLKNWKNRDDETGFTFALNLAPELLRLTEMAMDVDRVVLGSAYE